MSGPTAHSRGRAGPSRRGLLGGGAGALIAASSARASAATGDAPEGPGLIDVHCHWLPPEYLAALHAAGIRDVDGFPLPPWDEASHLALMDRHGIASSILSLSAPGVMFAETAAARSMARRLNDAAAERRVRSRGRFGAFALLVLPDVEGSLREMEYALDVLKLDGIGVYTNAKGVYLGDPRFEPLMAEAHRRGCVVYTHPIVPPGFEALSLGLPGPAIEYPFDTTRMLMNLAVNGVLTRYPDLKLIASHGGGTLPYLAERVATMTSLFGRSETKLTQAEALAALRRVYFDTTAVANSVSLASYRAFVPADRRLFGSDTPFMREQTINPAIAALRNAQTGLAGEEFEAMAHGNATTLFPGLTALRSAQ